MKILLTVLFISSIANASLGVKFSRTVVNKVVGGAAAVLISITQPVVAVDVEPVVSQHIALKILSADQQIPLYELLDLDYGTLIRLLTSGRVAVNAQDKHGRTALHYPYMDLDVDIAKLKLFLAAGADPTHSDFGGFSPFHPNYYDGHPEGYQIHALFIEAVHGVNGSDEYGRKALGEALLYATYGWDLATARALVADGAEVSYDDYVERFELLDVASQAGALTLLMMDREAYRAELERQPGGIAAVLKTQGEHLVYLATKFNNPAALEVLLTNGAVISVSDGDYMRWAFYHSSFDLVAMLLARGGSTILNGRSAYLIWYDRIMPQHGSRNVKMDAGIAALLLLASGESEDHVGRTAMHWADISGSATLKQVVAGAVSSSKLVGRKLRDQIKREMR
ncbi:MAG: hypothetical protein OYH77_01490 [Pseudomonadota bacterium]|nr:hypothetical protein [Pseudomonadota bacterium]